VDLDEGLAVLPELWKQYRRTFGKMKTEFLNRANRQYPEGPFRRYAGR
jgi:hypothetical protein